VSSAPAAIPGWNPAALPQYEAVIGPRSRAVQARAVADRGWRLAALADPRIVHAELFEGLTPPEHPEFAGGYRGTPGTALEHKRAGQPSPLNPGEVYAYLPPEQVAGQMAQISALTLRMFGQPLTAAQQRQALAWSFGWFGSTHPFVDGNGHVQRALFVAQASEFGLELDPRWTVHPRPYDRLLGIALEMFARQGERAGLGLVSEYLALFVR
jgi:fido (protein-threonine AMPylation protein)